MVEELVVARVVMAAEAKAAAVADATGDATGDAAGAPARLTVPSCVHVSGAFGPRLLGRCGPGPLDGYMDSSRSAEGMAFPPSWPGRAVSGEPGP